MSLRKAAGLVVTALGLTLAPGLSDARACTPGTFEGAWNGEITLCQNWNADEQQRFWFTAQGSLIVPYDWFLELEQESSTDLFRDGENIDGFRYLPQRPTSLNPDGLPIGFTKDTTRRRKPYVGIAKHWLGMTCAACHTNQIEHAKNGTTHRILIDGGPSMGDFQGFMESLVDALKATANDAAKFDRFAAAVLTRQGSPRNRSAKRRLKADLDRVIQIRKSWNDRNKGPHRYGFARLDALGAIFNEVTTVPLGLPDNHSPANAPVSYPFLWDTPHYDRVQWNGSIENKGTGALVRNIGEVLGVFGGLRYGRVWGNRTSINIKHLGELEALISTLEPPAWPEPLLGEIDRSSDTQRDGRKLFESYCIGCHKDTKAADASRPFEATMMSAADTGTDPLMATNFMARMQDVGKLEGRRKGYIVGKRFSAGKAPNIEILGYAVGGTLFHEIVFNTGETLEAIRAGRTGPRLKLDQESESRLTRRLVNGKPTKEAVERFLDPEDDSPACDPRQEACYKARSLNGIWATAPYLHNGSVRTLRQLLLPAAERDEQFRVGTRAFDPENVGYANQGGFLFDTSLPGNSNAGHEGAAYGTEDLANNPEKLEALLEYLKTL